MAIAPKPPRKAAPDVESFISGAVEKASVPSPTAEPKAEEPRRRAAPAPARSRKVPVMLRLDEDLLARIDTAAKHSYQSRTAWIAGNLARVLDDGGF